MPPFPNFAEHREEHDALHVDIGSTGSASNVPELRNLDALAIAVQRVHHYGCGREIEPLRKGRRRNRDFQYALLKKALDLLAIGSRQGAMMQGNTQSEAFQDGTVRPKPFLALAIPLRGLVTGLVW